MLRWSPRFWVTVRVEFLSDPGFMEVVLHLVLVIMEVVVGVVVIVVEAGTHSNKTAVKTGVRVEAGTYEEMVSRVSGW